MDQTIAHIGNRSARQGPLFLTDDDRLWFLGHLGAVCKEFGLKIIAFALMSNHYHLLMALPNELRTQFLRKLNFCYARRFNQKTEKSGHVFEANTWVFPRWMGVAYISRYIHLNPAVARMVSRLIDYPWSSYRAIIGLEPRPDWLDPTPAFEELSGTADQKIAMYRSYVESGTEDLAEYWALIDQWQKAHAGDPQMSAKMPLVELIAMTMIDISKRMSAQAEPLEGMDPRSVQFYMLRRMLPVSERLIADVTGVNHRTLNRKLHQVVESLAEVGACDRIEGYMNRLLRAA